MISGWKLALGLELSPESLHPTTLCTFRERLLNHNAAKLAFDAVLGGLINAGLVSRRSKRVAPAQRRRLPPAGHFASSIVTVT